MNGFDKIPPQNIEFEKLVLGAAMLESGIFEIIAGYLKEEAFYNPAHSKIFKAITELNTQQKPIDLLTVVDKLRELQTLDEVGGAYYVSSITNNIGSASNIEYYCQVLSELFIRRQLIQLCHENLNKLFDNSIELTDIYHNLTSGVDTIFDVSKSNSQHIFNVMCNRLDQISKIEPGKLVGISTGISNFDQTFGGWQDSDMILLGARPSMGKTAVSLLFAKTPIFTQKKRVLYFSLEMPAFRLADRIMSLETGINSELMQNNRLQDKDWLSLSDTIQKYDKVKFDIIDESGLTIEEIKAMSILENRKHKIDLIIIDYLQLIGFTFKDGRSTNDNVSHISKNIKSLAKKLNIPVIALSQLNREVEKRGNKRPELSDLRDSGSIEQDADMVMFLYRDEFYNPNTEDVNRIEIIIRKHRNGRIGMDYLYKNENWSYLSDKPYEEYFAEQIPNF